jgi:hypothetical protein
LPKSCFERAKIGEKKPEQFEINVIQQFFQPGFPKKQGGRLNFNVASALFHLLFTTIFYLCW